MNKFLTISAIGLMALVANAQVALATPPDQYPGDSAIYGVQAPLQPNVMVIIDDSGSMADPVPAQDYNPATTYGPVGKVCATGSHGSLGYCCTDTSGNAAECVAGNIYAISNYHDNTPSSELNKNGTPTTMSQMSQTLTCGTITPYTSLNTTGMYSGYTLSPTTGGGFSCNGSGGTVYATGNYVAYLNTTTTNMQPKLTVAQSVVTNLISSSDNVKFGLMTYGNGGSSWNGNTGGMLISVTPSWSKVTGHTNGTVYTTYAQKMDAQFPPNYAVTNTALNTPCSGPTGTVCTNRDALNVAIASLASGGGTPIGQVLVEAGRTFCGCDASGNNCGQSPYGNTVGTGIGATYCSTSKTSYPNPIDAPCQKNYIVLVTDGMSTLDDQDLTSSGGPGILQGLCPVANSTTSNSTGNCASDGCACCYNSGSCTYSGSTGGSCNSSTTTNQCVPNGGLGIDNSATQVAKFLYNSPQAISTFAIGFHLIGSDTAAIGMLTTATDNSHGHGNFFAANTQTDLSTAFSQIMAQIYQVDSSYVAPVVPSSPQNRSYSGNRIYMGFFEPRQNTTWYGNLKKYGLGNFTYSGKTYANAITDVSGVPATWVDLNSDGLDDIYGTSLTALGVTNGSLKSTSKSFWSTAADGQNVNAGGVGSILEANSASSRTIYTETSSGGSLVSLKSSAVTPQMLGYAAGDTTDATNLVNFTYGQDVLNESGNGTSANRNWMMGDVLHSQPLVLNYTTYTPCDPCAGDTCVCSTGGNASCVGGLPFPNNCSSATPTANEKNCSVNKSLIYVGGNDGMLHAFKDCDGSEAWAFVPYEFLGDLPLIEAMVNNTTTQPHNYFVDGSFSKYVYNKALDGNINTGNGDKAVLVFGTRRGGGNATAPTTGPYYALDVSNPASPSLLWTITPGSTGFSELAESWSNPNIVTMKINGVAKVVAIFGAGYDNPNEDGRFGATQYFQGNAAGLAPSSTGQGNTTSPSVTTGTLPYSASPKGRGIYLVELATLNSGVPSFTNSGKLLWSYTYGTTASSSSTGTTDPNMLFSIPSDVTAWDADGDGFADRLYVGDQGGNIWRFNVSDQVHSANWSGTKIFQSNPCTGTACSSGAGDVGRKIFYKPSAVRQNGYVMLFFGTGDREHPTNTAVIDRIYALKDPVDVNYGGAPTLPLTESNLMDVTADTLQAASTSSTTVNSLLSQLNGQTAMSSGSYAYGWFIKLNATTNSGEKVLAPPVVFNGDATFNTYTPIASTASSNTCTANLGTATQYDMNYLTGEAIINKNTADDSTSTTNVRALYNNKGTYSGSGGSGVLQASDRSQTLGSGIPSGSVVVITPGGQAELVTGGSSAIITGAKNPGGTVLRLYWRQK